MQPELPLAYVRIMYLLARIAGGAMAKKKETYASEFARKGGYARARKLTPEQRSESARRAVKARWAKTKKKN